MSTLIKTFISESGHRLELYSAAMDHIILGDIKDRVNRHDGVNTVDKILTGGMHTIDGWKNFLTFHPCVSHVRYFNSDVHTSWYYGRELQNGVVTLRIPKKLFGGKAAKITKFPDYYYKSGYLWKTLFPKGIGEEELLNIIEESLSNINAEDTSQGEIIGYCNIHDPLKIMRVVIMFRDNKIHSVFPSWTQPNTGNNGKAFSHIDNIGHVINAATVYFDDVNSVGGSSFIDENKIIQSLNKNTPNIFLTRSKPGKYTEKWVEVRDKTLKEFVYGASESEALEIYNYVTDIKICKEYELVRRWGYNYEFGNIKKSLAVFNSFQIPQNIIDSLSALYSYDILYGSRYFSLAVDYLLKNMVTFVGIDSWVKRKIFVKIVSLLPSYDDLALVKKFLNSFSESPTRREFYIEFSFDSQVKKDLKMPLEEIPDELILVENPSLNLKVEYRHFLEYINENLGETYSLHFNDQQRRFFVEELILSGGDNYKELIEDTVRYVTLSDFNSFPDYFDELIKYLLLNNDVSEVEGYLKIIIRDYCRIQSAQRFRLNLLYKDYLDYQVDIDNLLTKESIYYTVLKHERIMNSLRVDVFLDSIELLLPYIEGTDLEEDIIEKRDRAGKDVPPAPDLIPKYILQRGKNHEESTWQ